MQITTESILKLIAIDSKSANKLISDFQALDIDKKFLAERVIWDAYDELFNIRVEVNLQKAFEDVKNGKRELSNNFYKEIKEETENELEKEFLNKSTNTDLAAVREKLEKVIQQQGN